MAVADDDTGAQQDYTIDTPSIYSNDADDNDNFSGWPHLIGLEDEDLDNDYSQQSWWRSRRRPSELHHLPDDCPDEVARIVRESVVPDLHISQTADGGADDDGTENPNNKQQPASSMDECSTSLGSRSEPNTTVNSSDHTPSLSGQSSPSSRDATEALSARVPTSITSSSTTTKQGRAPGQGLKPYMKERHTFRECASCFCEILDKNLLTLSCQHKYCFKCLQNLITLAMDDESQFPPKCCLQEIPKDVILDNLDSAKRKVYNAKYEEYSISQQERWYCPLPTCRKWIPPKNIKRKAKSQKCPSCRLPICSTCRGIAHRSPDDCPNKLDPASTLSPNAHLTQKECPSCRSVVQVAGDGQYMTCRCGEQLCNACGARKGSCGCCTEGNLQLQQQECWMQRMLGDQQSQRQAAEIAVAMEEIKLMEQQGMEEKLRIEAEHKQMEEEHRRWKEEESRIKGLQQMETVDNAMRTLREELYRINRLQQHRIAERHRVGAQGLHSKALCDQTSFEERRANLSRALKTNIQQRTRALENRHQSEFKGLISRQEEDEDDAFLSVARHLKGKNNREEREQAMMERLKEEHGAEQNELRKSHEEEAQSLQQKGNLEKSALESGLELELEEVRRDASVATRGLGQEVIADRQWFDMVVEKRSRLLEEYRTEVVEGNKDVPKIEEPETPVDEPLPHPRTTWHIEDKLAALPRIDTNLSNVRPHRMPMHPETLVCG